MYITDENADRVVSMINTEMSQILNEGKLSKEIVCLLGEMVDVLKDIRELDMGEDEGSSYNSYGSYAGGGNSRRGGGSYRGGSYEGGYSGRRSYEGGSSYRRGYSRGSERDHLMEKMDQFMNQASNESERQLVRRIMEEL